MQPIAAFIGRQVRQEPARFPPERQAPRRTEPDVPEPAPVLVVELRRCRPWLRFRARAAR